MAGALPPERIGAALAAITAWRLNHDAPVACPACGAKSLAIVDQSARPYAEWYALTCESCGLNHNVHIPLAPPTPGGMD